MHIHRENYRFDSEVVLFINGQFPSIVPELTHFKKIFCTDGAYKNLHQLNIQPDVVSGDFDSVLVSEISSAVKVIETPDQNATDFEKALRIIIEEGFKSVSVFGCSGLEQDHFLGNLTSMLKHKHEIDIRCFDDFGFYFFAEKETEIEGFQQEVFSLYPFPEAKKITSTGVKYSLQNENLTITSRIGTRNTILENRATVSFQEGNLLLFIQDRLL
ncbi:MULTISPECIES: thiamine diphosphokinase [Mesonia]|uniref:Thiamine pyrophosphokinase n=1 Tax=Mesonia oceanica TaxID=2687242 RepID=A0AC61YCA8_9FLAO|nr:MULTISPECIES: thiamine diphosphokinase [Mesonia]MAN27143.1 thiamine diphosphokinase [Mesonia sp.]MAQ42028.1 thiamine diphosphokinase [Mesonia sp.]MBJ97615.1 thiamine diphosphokinase [Flavobacteriaceae bacterium]VVV02131.1 Thiamine pyrophosphokinase [Mesonia oceanica]|tara:strand:- start:55260 stop:55904 length:645 start_codon:yes stop_codon:yes gene_type:complete